MATTGAKRLHMGNLACDSERVPMEACGISFACKGDTAVLGEALPLAGKTPCSHVEVELQHSQEGTHKQGRDAGSLETEWGTSESPSSGVKRGKGGDGKSHVISDCSEPKESSTYDRSLSFPPMPRLISAMKGGRERSGKASPTENRHVNWAPDVYDPPVTSVDHTVKGHEQRRRSRKKDKNKEKQKQKQKKRKSRGNSKKSGLHDSAAHSPPALEVPGTSSPSDDGELGSGEVEEAEWLDAASSSAGNPSVGLGFTAAEAS